MTLNDHYKAVRARLTAGRPTLPPEPVPASETPPEPTLAPIDLREAHAYIDAHLDDATPRWRLILRGVCERHGVTRDDLAAKRKGAWIMPARLEAYWLLRQAGYSYGKIGSLLNKDHTTVIHGINVYARKNQIAG
jgi:chromosomal replication initiation ATPase DnaA